MPGAEDLDYTELVDASEGCSGKDIMTVVSLAVKEAIEHGIKSATSLKILGKFAKIANFHFQLVFRLLKDGCG